MQATFKTKQMNPPKSKCSFCSQAIRQILPFQGSDWHLANSVNAVFREPHRVASAWVLRIQMLLKPKREEGIWLALLLVVCIYFDNTLNFNLLLKPCPLRRTHPLSWLFFQASVPLKFSLLFISPFFFNYLPEYLLSSSRNVAGGLGLSLHSLCEILGENPSAVVKFLMLDPVRLLHTHQPSFVLEEKTEIRCWGIDVSGDFSYRVQAKEVSRHYKSHARIWLGDNPGRGWGRMKKMLSFPFKQGEGCTSPEFVPKFLSDPECLETVKV